MHKQIVLLCILFTHANLRAEFAVCIKPVADLVGQPMSTIAPHESTQQIYDNMPCSPEEGRWASPRIHQLLLHEIVELVDDGVQDSKDGEVWIEIQNAFFHNHEHPFPHDKYARYWTLKSNIITFTQMQEMGINTTLLPQPIAYKHHNIVEANQNVVTLSKPLVLAEQLLSVGTRFVCQQEEAAYYQCWMFNSTTQQMSLVAIAKDVAIKQPHSIDAAIEQFVQILKQWSSGGSASVIPFVWGGCSAREFCSVADYTFERRQQEGVQIVYFTRPLTHKPYAGFDSSGLLLRAAQICGIPYYFKNSSTASSYLRPLHAYEELENGDIIWLPVGLLVVSDCSNNNVITSQGYRYGNGYVQEIALADLFTIETIQDLIYAYRNNLPLVRKLADGSTQTYHQFKLLKLRSAWDN